MADISTSQNEYNYNFSNFIYRGEGNANLVIAHLKEEVIVRFHKQCSKSDVPIDGGYSRVIREVHFAKTVLFKLLGCYISIPEITYYDNKILDNLINSIRELRPSVRLEKSTLEPFATKLPDYTLLPKELNEHPSLNSVFCVEIKPKQGYITEVDRKFSKCPYCVKQFQKVKTTSNMRISNYCPFDLFSGNEERMNSAIMNLMKNPQNNLKIFKDGIISYDQESSHNDLYTTISDLFNYDCMEMFPKLLIKILLHPFYKEEYLTMKQLLMSDTKVNDNLNIQPRIEPRLTKQLNNLLRETCKGCDFNCDTLPQGCVLERILQMQKLHQHGDDVVYAIYEKYYDILCDNLIHANIVNNFKNAGRNNLGKVCDSNDLLHRSNKGQYFKRRTPTQTELKILQNYLLFCTAKDCSIMICFKRVNNTCDAKVLDSANVIELLKDHKYIVSVNISDCDLKNVQCIERHYKRDNSLINEIISTLSEKTQ